jgi:hypothetical protein
MSSTLGLATEQFFSGLHIQTEANAKLSEAAKAFNRKEFTKSANLFLESWRILQLEYERNLYIRNESLIQQGEIAWESNAIKILSLFALHDLAKVCSCNTEEYKDAAGNCKLEVHHLRHGWCGNTTTDILETEVKSWDAGSAVTHALRLIDPIGRLLGEANSFQQASKDIGLICSLRVLCATAKYEDHLHGYKFIKESLIEMNILEEELDEMYRHYPYDCDLGEKREKRDGERFKGAGVEKEPPFDWSQLKGAGVEKKPPFDWSQLKGTGAKDKTTPEFFQPASKKKASTPAFFQPTS